MAWIKEKFVIPKTIKPRDRVKIAEIVIDHIISRSLSGLDKNNKKFPPYSKTYADRKNVGIGDVDLTLSGELLESIKLLNHKAGEITIGFDKGDKELNGKAEGNILGSYGREPNKKKARDFLGIPNDELDVIAGAFEAGVDLTGQDTSGFDVGALLDEILAEELK